MIKSFAHKGIKTFFETGSKAGIRAAHASQIAITTGRAEPRKEARRHGRPELAAACTKGNLSGHWAVTVNGNWRISFRFENGDALLVDYQDYH